SINAAVMVSQDGAGVSAPEAIAYLENVWLNLIAENTETCRNGAFRIRANLFKYLNPQCLSDPARSLAELSEDSSHLAQSFLARTVNFFGSSGNIPTRAL